MNDRSDGRDLCNTRLVLMEESKKEDASDNAEKQNKRREP